MAPETEPACRYTDRPPSRRAGHFRTWILASILPLAIVPLLSFSIAAAHLGEGAVTSHVLAQLRSAARARRLALENSLDHLRDQVALIASRTRLRELLANCPHDMPPAHHDAMRAILVDAKAAVHAIQGICVVAADGFTICTNDGHDAEYVHATAVPATLEMQVARGGSGVLSVIAVGAIEYAGRPLARVELESRADEIQEVIDDATGLGASSEVLVLRAASDGAAMVLFQTGARAGDLPWHFDLAATHSEAAARALDRQTAVFESLRDRRGVEVLAATEWIPDPGWGLVVKTDRAEALADIGRLRGTVAIVIPVIALAAGFISFRLARALAQPLSALAATTTRLAGGELRERTEVPAGPAEIRGLALAFNSMADRLAESHGALEHRVCERTAELDRSRREIEARVNDVTAMNRELESFSYSVSHDLRAPLRAIDGFTRALEEDHGTELGPDARRLLGVVRDNARRMGVLIEDLLAFSRLGKAPLVQATVDMERLVDEVVAALRVEAAGRRIDLRRDALAPASGDESLLRQVWTNLLSNAFKYTRPRGIAEVAIGCERRGGEIVYEVRDNGVGFDPRFAARLFGIFQRLHTDAEFEGTGVGLALVQRIVHRHGGRVWAESVPGSGATFSFSLPEAAGGAGSDRGSKE